MIITRHDRPLVNSKDGASQAVTLINTMGAMPFLDCDHLASVQDAILERMPRLRLRNILAVDL